MLRRKRQFAGTSRFGLSVSLFHRFGDYILYQIVATPFLCAPGASFHPQLRTAYGGYFGSGIPLL